MPQLPLVESDKRVLKEDYCNYDLIARFWNDEYRGRAWKNKERIADYEGTDLEEIIDALRAIVDDIQQEKRRQRGKKKPAAREIADAIIGIEPKLSRTQKMMLAIHGKSPGQRLSVKAISPRRRLRQRRGRVRRLRRGRASRLRRTGLQPGQPQEGPLPRRRAVLRGRHHHRLGERRYRADPAPGNRQGARHPQVVSRRRARSLAIENYDTRRSLQGRSRSSADSLSPGASPGVATRHPAAPQNPRTRTDPPPRRAPHRHTAAAGERAARAARRAPVPAAPASCAGARRDGNANPAPRNRSGRSCPGRTPPPRPEPSTMRPAPGRHSGASGTMAAPSGTPPSLCAGSA
jgi:hypothetical protein